MDRVTKDKIIKGLLISFGFVVAVSALSIAGKWDAEVAEMIERDYCTMVSAGVHGHYNKLIDCSKWSIRPKSNTAPTK